MSHNLLILETDRLRLSRLRPSDVSALVDLWSDPDVTRYMGGPRDRAKLEANFAEEVKNPFADEYNLWPVEEQTGKVVGDCGLLDKEVDGRAEIELVYVFARSTWGQGYATEMAKALKEHAFEQMGLRRLIALIQPENEESERVAVKVGTHLEKEVIRPGGEVRRVYAMETEAENQATPPAAVTRIVGGTTFERG